MPLIKPELQKALRAAGLASPESASSEESSDKSSFQLQLERAGLGLEDTLQELSNISKTSVSEHLKLRSIETVLKLHQVLKEQPAAQIPAINIIIQDSNSDAILEGTNPIFLPRQLINKLAKNQGGSLEDILNEGTEIENQQKRPN